MHPRIAELFDHLDRTRAELGVAVDEVPSDLRSVKPTPEAWSVAQVVEHLAIVERRLAPMLSTQIMTAKAAGLAPDPESSSILAAFDIAPVLDRSRKIASASAPPTGAVSAI